MISIDDVDFRYRDSGFRLIVRSFAVSDGGAVAIVGPSGSGKTTLLNLAAGILVPESGRVRSGDVEISSLPDAARRDFRIRHVGLVFQEFELLEHLNVLDNILLPCRINARVAMQPKYRDQAIELAREVGMGDKLCRYVQQLSQGERQRVAICRALLLGPRMLLCDEPTGNLDPTAKEQVLSLLLAYVKRESVTMLFATHDHGLLGRFDETINVSAFHIADETMT